MLAILSCKHEVPKPSAPEVCFEKEILPLLVSNCSQSGCHNSVSSADGVILTDYANILATGEVSPGNPDESDLYEVLIKGEMPPQGETPLTQQQIDLISNWISQGAKNTTCESICDTNTITYTASVKPLLDKNCVGCHSGSNSSGGVNLSNANGINIVINNGKLLQALKQTGPAKPMPPPPTGKLSDCEIRMVEKWIQAGNPYN
ncbi:MAG: c-type cytochrome [Bacteroidota bacterium]|jgi:mono/diheme cytochrome c family protein